MVSLVVSAGRRAVAAFILVLTGVLAVWAATFKVWYLDTELGVGGKAEPTGFVYPAPQPVPHADCVSGGGLYSCAGVSPAWTIPTAIAVAAVGLVVAVVLHRFRRGAAEGRAVDLSRPRPANF